jgi:hypothetical protein
MKESICELANERIARDEQWHRHASACPDCRDLMSVAEWMTRLADNTKATKGIPAPGYLLFKARIQERRSAVDRAARPIYAMSVAAGILFIAAVTGLFIGVETRFASILINGLSLLSSYAGMIVVAAVIVAAACTAAAYFEKLSKD